MIDVQGPADRCAAEVATPRAGSWDGPGASPAVSTPSGPTGFAGPIRFSVVIPALNEAASLPLTLRSLQEQDFTGRVEIIVVDNRSTDATSAIAAAHGARVLCEPRRGVCFARQRGTAAARGEIVVSTDADTTHPVSWLSSIDAAFRANRDCVAVAGPCRFAEPPAWGAWYVALLFGAVHAVYRVLGSVFYITATNTAFRRDAWTGYDTRLTQGGDELDLLRRLRRVGPVVFDRSHPVVTSSRRLRRGLFYNLFVSFAIYYLLGYLANRVFGRTVLRTAPEFRDVLAGRQSVAATQPAAVSTDAELAAARPRFRVNGTGR